MPLLYCLLFLLTSSILSLAQSSPGNRARMVENSAAPLWTQESWTTQGDAPLRTWREQLAARYTDKDIPDSVVQQYKQAALQAPQDRRKLFQWGYSAYLLYRSISGQPTDAELMGALLKAKSPYSYEFQRMHYLLNAAMGFQDQHSLSLGERLVKSNPRDYDVLVRVCKGISVETPESKRKALQYARDLIQLAPERAYSYAVLASIYNTIWILSSAKDTEAARQSVHYYQEYLSREKRATRAEDKKMVQSTIDHLNRYIAAADKNKAKTE